MNVKICGLRREEDVEYVNECKPDYAGFVFAKSKRQVTMEQAEVLRQKLTPQIKAVGVFVNERPEVIAQLVKKGVIQVIQLHGDETNNDIYRLRTLTGDVPIIKAVRVASKEDVTGCERILADFLLFDTYSQKEYGGTGKAFDWEILKSVKKPFFLAGGIHAGNVEQAMKMAEVCNLYAVDVSSGVETDGHKDRDKILELVYKIKGEKIQKK